MALSNRDRVGRAFERLSPHLDAFITDCVGQAIPAGSDWTALLEARDRKRNITGKGYDRFDVQDQFRMITDNIGHALQPGWYPFDDKLSRAEKSLVEELKDARNQWAHMKPFSADDAYRTMDTAERLLRAINAPNTADAVRDERLDLRRLSAAATDRKVVATADTVSSTGLLPWREVLQPHPDVRSGTFQAAEFAADLHQVSMGTADPEYGDPVQFFARTFLTSGLRDLLGGAVARVRGDKGASPVVNLQTTFGGGKTHSMLSLWHLFSGCPVTDLPQEIQELVGDPGLPPSVHRAAIVGNHLTAGQALQKDDGTLVHTLWGELAWQLGGAEGYALVAEADRTATNPGALLHELFARYSPAVVLIDEWVAYARQLVGRDDDRLVGGTFETQFTFAQTLTEAAAATPGVLVVISIPASPDAEDGPSPGMDYEVGGEDGKRALRLLQNVVRRVASQWRAATADESFEIVRRRLFQPETPQALAHISATAKEFVRFYGQHSAEFPSQASAPAFEARIRRSYPVHPELFDRLYEDWSTLDRFQRTRGVLRLMNTVVGALWRANDTAPLILPGTVPFTDTQVLTELTQYLEDHWKVVVDADVDGPQATPRQVDEDSPALLGARSVSQRLARTIFLGATPTLDTAQKGIERKRVFLGTAVPGDVPGNFHSALTQLSDRATYLYSSGPRYWYSLQANASRAARDHAAGLQPGDVTAEVVRRLRIQAAKSTTRIPVHVTAEPADVPDAEEFRLVVLPPQHTFDRKAVNANQAAVAARRVVDDRAGGARMRRNQLAVLALDGTRFDDVDRAVRDYLGWRHVAEHAEELGLNQTQGKQAADRTTQLDEAVTARLLDGYTALLVPTQEPGQPWTFGWFRADATSPSVVDRAVTRLRKESQLTDELAASMIRLQLDTIPAAWQDGHISVAALWELFAQFPYLPRLDSRAVLEAGVAGVLDNPMAWAVPAFALAAAFDESTGRYVDLRLPQDSAPFTVTGTTLLVQPARAEAQRAEEDRARRALHVDVVDDDTVVNLDAQPQNADWPKEAHRTSAPVSKRRFFGVRTLDPDRYGRDFAVLMEEVIDRLKAAGADVEVTVEIHARKADGFDDAVIRTVSENAAVLKLSPADFERD